MTTGYFCIFNIGLTVQQKGSRLQSWGYNRMLEGGSERWDEREGNDKV